MGVLQSLFGRWRDSDQLTKKRSPADFLCEFVDEHPILQCGEEEWQAAIMDWGISRYRIYELVRYATMPLNIRARLLLIELTKDPGWIPDIDILPARDCFRNQLAQVDYGRLPVELRNMVADFFCLVWQPEFQRVDKSSMPVYSYLDHPAWLVSYLSSEKQWQLCRVLYPAYQCRPWHFGILAKTWPLPLELRYEIDAAWQKSITGFWLENRDDLVRDYARLPISLLFRLVDEAHRLFDTTFAREGERTTIQNRRREHWAQAIRAYFPLTDFLSEHVDRSSKMMRRIGIHCPHLVCPNFLANYTILLNCGRPETERQLLALRRIYYRLLAASGIMIFSWHCFELYQKMLDECDPEIKSQLEAQIAVGDAEFARMQAA